MFNVEKYRKYLATRWLGQSIYYAEEMDSTSTYLKRIEPHQVTHGQICLTDFQTKGRGQYKRKWEGDVGQNLMFTLAFKPVKAERFHILTLACARSLAALIEEEMDCKAEIKWPNDVSIKGKKVAGLLTEAVFNGNKVDRLLIGIGINVNQTVFADEIKSKAGSLSMMHGSKIDRELFLAKLLSIIEFEYNRWHKQNDDLLKWINKKIIGYGEWVSLKIDGQKHAGKFKLIGIDQNGRLAVIDDEGGLKTFSYEQIRVIAD